MRDLGQDAGETAGETVATDLPGVIVASTGRSGSTLLHDALCEAMGRARGVPKHLATGYVWTLAEDPLERGIVYKTHDFPDALRGREDLRAVFTFGSLEVSVLSVLAQEEIEGRDWIDDHFDHLKAPGAYADILDEDALGLARQVEAWAGFDGGGVLCVRYDALWEAADRIAEFTGLPLELPARRSRAAKAFSPDVVDRIAGTYGPLDARFAALPDVFEAGPEMLKLLDGEAGPD